jgi:hypothetical protein
MCGFSLVVCLFGHAQTLVIVAIITFGMRSGNQLKITGSLWLTIFSLRMCTRPQDLLRRRFPTFFLLLKNATFLESLTILNIFIIKNFELAFDQKSFTNYYLSERGKAVH